MKILDIKKDYDRFRLSNIKKDYDRFRLSIENLEIPKGKIYGIIGANGCGKTTLMKIISGLLAPDAGHIDYGGLNPRDITMVFRKPYLMHDTVLKNLLYPLTLRKISLNDSQNNNGQNKNSQNNSGQNKNGQNKNSQNKNSQNKNSQNSQIEHYLKIAGLYEIKDEYAPALSGGQQQKLSLIRAHIFYPKLILIDEGFSNLDIKSCEMFEQFILDRQKENPITYIICAHQLSHIERLCDYVFFMHNGTIEEEGYADEILFKPKSSVLQNYLRFAGRVDIWNS